MKIRLDNCNITKENNIKTKNAFQDKGLIKMPHFDNDILEHKKKSFIMNNKELLQRDSKIQKEFERSLEIVIDRMKAKENEEESQKSPQLTELEDESPINKIKMVLRKERKMKVN